MSSRNSVHALFSCGAAAIFLCATVFAGPLAWADTTEVEAIEVEATEPGAVEAGGDQAESADSARDAARRRTEPDARVFVEGSERFIDMITGLGASDELQRAAEDAEIPADAAYFSVQAAVERALEVNPIAAALEEEVIQAEALVGQARSPGLPQVNGTYAWTHNDRGTSGGIGGGLGGGGLGGGMGGGLGGGGLGGGGLGGGLGGGGLGLKQFGGGGLGGGLGGGGLGSGQALFSVISQVAQSYLQRRAIEDAMPDRNIYTAGVTIQQVIYAGGEIRAGIRAAEQLAEAQRWQRRGALDTLEFNVKEAYYDLLLTTALVRVARDSVATFERNLADTRNMFEVGIMSNFEVLRAETELAARTADTVSARNAQRVAEARLRQLLVLPPDLPLEVDAQMDWLPLAAPAQELIDLAHSMRPEIRTLRLTIEAAKEDRVRVRAAYKPKIAATADYLSFDGAGSMVDDGWVFTVGANWELFAGGRRRHEGVEKRAEVRRLEHRLQELKDGVALEVTAYRIQLEDAMASAVSREKTVTLAREGLRLAELRFEEGVGTQSEILDAELALTNAETGLIQALRDFAVANAGIERAIGKSWMRDYGPVPLEEDDALAILAQ